MNGLEIEKGKLFIDWKFILELKMMMKNKKIKNQFIIKPKVNALKTNKVRDGINEIITKDILNRSDKNSPFTLMIKL